MGLASGLSSQSPGKAEQPAALGGQVGRGTPSATQEMRAPGVCTQGRLMWQKGPGFCGRQAGRTLPLCRGRPGSVAAGAVLPAPPGQPGPVHPASEPQAPSFSAAAPPLPPAHLTARLCHRHTTRFSSLPSLLFLEHQQQKGLNTAVRRPARATGPAEPLGDRPWWPPLGTHGRQATRGAVTCPSKREAQGNTSECPSRLW